MAKGNNMIYYITKQLRIKYDGYNYVPEILCKRQPKDENGNEIENSEPTITWGRFGYYATLKGALNKIIELYPTMVVSQDEGKEFMSIKKCLTLLKTLKESIEIQVLTETDKLDELEEEDEEEEDVKPKTKGKGKRTKSLSK